MRFLCTIVLTVAVMFSTMPVQAATVLSDGELGQMTAGEIQINPVAIQDSALALQNNIGVALSYKIDDVQVENENSAKVENTGNSAAALQSNIGAVVNLEGCETRGAEVENENAAVVENTVATAPDLICGIDAANVAIDGFITINGAEVENSAAVFQNNIGIVLTDADQEDSEVEQSNWGLAINNITPLGSSAATAQNNIGAILALDGSIDGAELENTNVGGAINGLNLIFDKCDMECIPEKSVCPTFTLERLNLMKHESKKLLRETKSQKPLQVVDAADIIGSNLQIDGLVINPVSPVDSAVVEQNNIGLILAQGCISDAEMENINLGLAANVGNSAAALQNNIGVIYAQCGIVDGAKMENLNGAIVANLATGYALEPGIDTANIELETAVPCDQTATASGPSALSLPTDSTLVPVDGEIPEIEINDVEATDSAIAAQNNIGVILGDDDISCAEMENTNAALVINLFGDSAAALQSNIGAIFTEGCAIENAKMHNLNIAAVANVAGLAADTLTGSNIEIGEGLVLVNPLCEIESAAAVQSNLGVIFSDRIDGACMSNDNIAFLWNWGNSAEAVQSNIGVIFADSSVCDASMENSNSAEVNNVVTVPVMDGITTESDGSAITASNYLIEGSTFLNPAALIETSALAQQSNIGVVFSNDSLSDVSISNTNCASVSNNINTCNTRW